MKTCGWAVLLVLLVVPLHAQNGNALAERVDQLVVSVEDSVIAWRRDVHQHPELSNREFRTAAKVTAHLERLGMEVRTEIAYTGVVGVLRGGQPGPVVALRADMDGLPVTEQVDLPFASKVRTTYNGQEVGVMHACGHDTHVAILMGVAEVLAAVQDDLAGTVLFIFQPAEEGAPPGEGGGAKMMLEEGAFADPKPEVVFGLHAKPEPEVGQLWVRPYGMMAASDTYRIRVQGQQTHGAYPWMGVDPVVVASQVVLGLQTVASRQINLTTAPAVISVGSIHGGVRSNIIPNEVELVGTIRTLDPGMQDDIHTRVRRTAEQIATSAGAKAEVTITRGYPVTMNDPELLERMRPTLARVAEVVPSPPQLGAEDFSYFANEVPGLYFMLGVRTPGAPQSDFPSNHSPLFRVDEAALAIGVRALTHLTLDYMAGR